MSNSPIQAVIFDWAGTIVDFGSFAPTSIFVEAFKQGFDFEIDLEEAREPMVLVSGITSKLWVASLQLISVGMRSLVAQ